jgi:hypothetical protein
VPCRLALTLCRSLVRSDVAQAFLDREFLDLGGVFMDGRGRVVALARPAMGCSVALVGPLIMRGGTPDVVRGHRFTGGKFCRPSAQLLSTLRSLVTR